VALPDRSPAAEDAFVAAREGGDVEDLVGAVTLAIEACRPRLAARLVGLLDGRVEIPPGSALERARRAASLVLLAEVLPVVAWEELQEAWAEARRIRLDRAGRRWRAALEGEVPERPPRSRRVHRS
jgi:hypothetical protein